jgi:hypothetical protein
MTELKRKLEIKCESPEPTTLASAEQLKALQAKYATTITVRGTKKMDGK